MGSEFSMENRGNRKKKAVQSISSVKGPKNAKEAAKLQYASDSPVLVGVVICAWCCSLLPKRPETQESPKDRQTQTGPTVSHTFWYFCLKFVIRAQNPKIVPTITTESRNLLQVHRNFEVCAIACSRGTYQPSKPLWQRSRSGQAGLSAKSEAKKNQRSTAVGPLSQSHDK